MVPPKRIGKRRPVERGWPGQEWLVDLSKDFSGSRFNLVSQWISVATAIDHVLAHAFHRQWESLTENPARLTRKSHRFRQAKSAQNT